MDIQFSLQHKYTKNPDILSIPGLFNSLFIYVLTVGFEPTITPPWCKFYQL